MTKLMKKKEVAEALGLSVRQVERMRIPRVAMPGTGRKPIVRYHPDVVATFVETHSSKKSTRRAG